MDTRAFRTDLGFAEAQIWEVDTLDLFKVKEPIVASSRQPLTCRQRNIVPLDVNKRPHTLLGMLEARGFLRQEPSCFVIEGLLMYLNARRVEQLLFSISSAMAPGSVVFHDCITKFALHWGLNVEGAPFISGHDDWAFVWESFGLGDINVAPGPAIQASNQES